MKEIRSFTHFTKILSGRERKEQEQGLERRKFWRERKG